MIRKTPLRPLAVQPSLAFVTELPRPTFFYDDPSWDDRAVERQVDYLIASGEFIPDSPYPLPKEYNGATGTERRAGGNKWMIAMRRGFAPRAKICSICLSTQSLQNHNENYFRPCNARPVCTRCHMLLHKRFYAPNNWLAVAHQHSYDGAWFRNIALHPLTREQSQHLATLDDPFDASQL